MTGEGFPVAAMQTAPRLGDVSGNREQLLSGVREAASAGARLIVFPECQLSGYAFDDETATRAAAETIPGRTTHAVAEAARRLEVEVVFGMIEASDDGLFNTLVAVGPAGIFGSYRKTHLPTLGADRFVRSGDRPYAVHSSRHCRLGLSICYDARFPEMHRTLTLLGADVIVVATCWPTGSEIVPNEFIPVRAAENRVFIVVAGRVGEENGTRFIGGSRVVAPDGAIVATAGAGPCRVLATIVPAEAHEKAVGPDGGRRSDILRDRRPDLYAPLVDSTAKPRTM